MMPGIQLSAVAHSKNAPERDERENAVPPPTHLSQEDVIHKCIDITTAYKRDIFGGPKSSFVQRTVKLVPSPVSLCFKYSTRATQAAGHMVVQLRTDCGSLSPCGTTEMLIREGKMPSDKFDAKTSLEEKAILPIKFGVQDVTAAHTYYVVVSNPKPITQLKIKISVTLMCAECSNGLCDPQSGICGCSVGWSGAGCDVPMTSFSTPPLGPCC